MAVKWYYKMAGQEIGPFTSQQLKRLAEEKRITPDDPVRRDIDTEWSIAKDVKGLFPPETVAIPMGTAVPVAPVKAEPVKAAPPVASAVPPGAVATKARTVRAVPPAPVAPKAQSTPDDEGASDVASSLSFDFEASSSQKGASQKASSQKGPARSGAGRSSARTAKRGVQKASDSASADDEGVEENQPLSKKELQKRNFIICAIAMCVVILLAILILVIVSCSGDEKPTVSEDASVATAQGGAEGDSEGDGASGKAGDGAASGSGSGSDGEGSDGEGNDGEGEHPFIPREWLDVGYRCPLDEKGGKPKSCTFGSMQVMIKRIEVAPLSSWNPKTRVKDKNKKCCFVKLEVKNVNKEGKLMDVPGWGAGGSHAVKLFDEKGNQYKTLKYAVPGQADRMDQKSTDESFTDILVFNAPDWKRVEFLRLELPATIKGEDDALLFLPKEFFLKKEADGEKQADASGEENAEGENAEGAELNDEGEDGRETKETKETAAASSAAGETKSEGADALSDETLSDRSGNSEDSGSSDRSAASGNSQDSAASGNSQDSAAPAPPTVGAEAKELDDATKEEEELDIFNDPSLSQ